MAVYFKIKMQYKRTHDGNIIETTGSDFALPLLERCIAAKKGPAPSRVLKDESFTFTSTEFPTDQDCCIRLCEASSTGSTFVRGILMVLDGESTHLETFHKLLADKVGSRRSLHVMPRGTREPMMFLPTMLRNAYATEQARYMNIHQQLRSLEAGVIGLQAVSFNSFDVPPSSGGAAADSSKTSEALIPQVRIDDDEQFALIFLSSKFAAAEPKKSLSCASLPTDSITKLFEDGLLSRHPKEDCWDETGSAYFRKTLEYFLHRGSPIQFCLPAFPCKSTNPRKTSGAAPDGAEYEAFSHLHRFCENLRKIYPPGADFTVVSDGHVFSDCIGTDDIEVYKYTDAVKELSDKVFSNLSLSGGKSPITFVNLRDIFYGPNKVLLRAFKIAPHEDYPNRPIKTQINSEDENCRRLMLRSCGFDAGMLEKAIKDDEAHPLTKIYRGFSRFMKDDLDDHPEFKYQSASKRGDLANGVAKEMLRRNQAYSHLVELLNPRAIRISIHQHKNHGPKFAINTLKKERFRAIQRLEDIYSSDDGAKDAQLEEAHIPTPWHNVLIEVEGHAMTYIGKNGIVLDEKENPDSLFVCAFRDKGRGARWFLRMRV